RPRSPPFPYTTLFRSSRPGHLRAVLVTLDRLRLGNETHMSKPLTQLCDALTKRGMVVLISDLLDDPAAVVRGLKHFQFRGADVIDRKSTRLNSSHLGI